MKKYTFYVQRSGGKSPRSYTKTEDKLDEREINLLTGNLINEFRKAPDKVKSNFIDNLFKYIQQYGTTERDNSFDTTEHDVNINDSDINKSSGIENQASEH